MGCNKTIERIVFYFHRKLFEKQISDLIYDIKLLRDNEHKNRPTEFKGLYSKING